MLILQEPSLEAVGYGIDVDEFNLILCRLKIVKEGKNAGQVRKEAVGYYNSVEACLERVYQLEVQSIGLADLVATDKAVRLVIAQCSMSLKSFREKYEALQACE